MLLILCCLGLVACDDPGACNKTTAAQFIAEFKARKGHAVDWSLQYIADTYISKVYKSDYIDKRYGSRVCKMETKNINHDFIIDSYLAVTGYAERAKTCKICYMYVPRTRSYSIISSLSYCCQPDYVDLFLMKM